MKQTRVATKTANNTLAFVGDADFKIEDGVPLPRTSRPARPARYFPFDKLKAGQSFLVPKDRKKGLRPALSRHHAAHPAARPTAHLIVAHEVTNIGNDRRRLSTMAKQAQEATGVRELTAIAGRGYFKGEEILACEATGVMPVVPKPPTSGAKADGRFGKQDFVYDAAKERRVKRWDHEAVLDAMQCG
jgi:hypothetical protein